MKHLIILFIMASSLYLQASIPIINDPAKAIEYFKLDIGMDIETDKNSGISHLKPIVPIYKRYLKKIKIASQTKRYKIINAFKKPV